MGTIADVFWAVVRRPSRAMPPITPAWQQWGGTPQGSYMGYSRAYMRNEIVFSCIEMLATSAGEPHIVGRRWQRESPMIRNEEQRLLARGVSLQDCYARMVRNGFYRDLPNHPLIRLLSNPNPFMSRGQMWGTIVMDRALAGNSYLLKARTQGGPFGGAVGELWRLRPDRVRIIPDANKYISAYEYRTGSEAIVYPPEDIIHFKTRNPLNDYYGMPPLMAVAGRVDIDDYMQGFLRSFFERGGTGPGSILTVKNKLSDEAKREISERFRRQFGPGGYHEMLIMDQAESTYQQMGLNRGLRDALPKEIDNVTEARIAMVFGIPGSILGLLIGYESSSYANKRQDWQVFWDLTMTPLLSDLDDVLNLSLVPDFGGIDEVLFDLSDIRALQEDVDKIHERIRKNVAAGLQSWEEGRDGIGLDPNPKEGTFLIPANIVPTQREDLEEPPEPPPAIAPVMPALPEPAEEGKVVVEARCPNCNRLLGHDVSGARFDCPRCKTAVVVQNGVLTTPIA
jgi:HK97 family phage portal protein